MIWRIFSDVNTSQPHYEADSISSIIFKGIVSPAGSVNGTYLQYLVNQSQIDVGVPVIQSVKGIKQPSININ